MKIEFIDIQNFRKLKKCRIDFSEKETLFVGANNSGKTSAMDALVLFFKFKSNFTTRDFTLSNWRDINSIGESWLNESDIEKIDLSLEKWEDLLPTLDVWLNVKANKIHYVHELIPTLDWKGGLLGVRLRYEPKNIEDLHIEFKDKYSNAKSLANSDKSGKSNFTIWPKDMWDFLDKGKKINELFSIKTYLLNPVKSDKIQKLPNNSTPLDSDAFGGLIKIDIINAQRGFTGTNPEESESANIKNLSGQLRSYYDKHLNPLDNPTSDDIKAIEAIQEAKKYLTIILRRVLKVLWLN
jgi:predicted ATP-dependent endonuclease of OLD family